MKSKKRWGINRKVMSSIIFLTLLINIISCVAGSINFTRAIQKQYNDKGYVIGEIILNEIDHDKIAEYTRTWEADDYYWEMERFLQFVEETSNAAFIYIAVPYEDRTMRYVYDSDTVIGDTDPIAASFEEIWTAYTDGVRPQSYLVRNSKKYGFLTSSCLPVKDSSGNVIALLFVDTSMEVIITTIRKYVVTMLLISLVLLGLFCILHWHYMHKYLIGPLLQIRNNVAGFAKDNAAPQASLDSIRTRDELEDLAVSVSSMEKDIVKYIDNIKTITAEKERISTELNVASRIQREMLPSIFPAFMGRKEFDIYATMSPAKEVGGDFYDFFFIDENHLALVLADVSGKGVPAALFMVIVKTLIKNRTFNSRVLSEVNDQLLEDYDTGLFATVWFAILDLSTGKGIASNAGHEHPAIRHEGGEYELVKYKHSPAVSTFKGMKYEEHEFELHPGDSLFIYTDGVTEATNSENVLFGTDRMLEVLNKDPDASTEDILVNVIVGINEFVGMAPQFDDITMLGFKYYGK